MRFTGFAAVVAIALFSNAAVAQPKPQAVAEGLVHPWAVAFIEEGRFLITERGGRLRVVEANGTVGPAVIGTAPSGVIFGLWTITPSTLAA